MLVGQAIVVQTIVGIGLKWLWDKLEEQMIWEQMIVGHTIVGQLI